MLNFSKTTQIDAIEKHVLKPLDKVKVNPLSKDQTEILFKLNFIKEDMNVPEQEKPLLWKIIDKRINLMHDYKIEDKAMMFLLSEIQSPGEAIIYIWKLQEYSTRRKKQLITLTDICMDVIPMGFYDSKGLSDIWDKQKIQRRGRDTSDNLVDYFEAGKSLM